MTKPAIKVEGLWKEYVVGHAQEKHGTFYDMLSHSLKAPFKRLKNLGGQHREIDKFWALQDVSFEVQPGEVVGVIGRNGAGKSTLLKILSRITAPTKGQIEVRGRLASLLEVGTGFHPELSGRENIYLNGAILGMTRKEVARKFDEIVAFAEIEKFIDTPVKRYSSGMYVRLAFAVSAHLDVDVLLVDEVLAVGDLAFQQKCLGKMNDAAKSGRTVVFVSHNLSALRSLCNRAILLEDGRFTCCGPTSEILSVYESRVLRTDAALTKQSFSGPLREQVDIDKLCAVQDGQAVTAIDPLKAFSVEVWGHAHRYFPQFELNISLYRDGFHIATCFDTPEAAPMHEGAFISRYEIPGGVLSPGTYCVGVGAYAAIGSWMWGKDVAVLTFIENYGDRLAHQVGAVSIPFTSERVCN